MSNVHVAFWEDRYSDGAERLASYLSQHYMADHHLDGTS